MSNPLFRPWVDKEEEAAPVLPPLQPHVNEQQQQRDRNDLIIQPSGSQQRSHTKQETLENGNKGNKFTSKQNTQNYINTPQPPPAHTSQPTSITLHETAASSAASTSSSPLSLVLARQHLTSPWASHSGYTNSLPRPYTPKHKIAPTIEATSAHQHTSDTSKFSYTPAAHENNRIEESSQTSRTGLPTNPNIMSPLENSNEPSMQPNSYGKPNITFQLEQTAATAIASQSLNTTNGQHPTAPPTSQHFTTGEGRDPNSSPQLHMNQVSSQFSLPARKPVPVDTEYILPELASLLKQAASTSVRSETFHNTALQTSMQLSLPATRPVSETAPVVKTEIQVEDTWIDTESQVWSPLQKSAASSFCSEISQNSSEQHLAPPPPPSFQTSTPDEGYDTNSLPQLHTSQASEQTLPAAKPVSETVPTVKMEVEDGNEEIRIKIQLSKSAVSPNLEESASSAGYDTNYSLPQLHVNETSNQLSVQGTKAISDTVPTEQMEINNDDSWEDIESSESDTSANSNGQYLTPPPSSQSCKTVVANNAKSSVQPTELPKTPITKTNSTDSDIENKNPQENIQITDNREPKSPTPPTCKPNESSAAVVRTETTHEQHSPPRCSKTADNNNTSPLAEPQRRRSARQAARNSTHTPQYISQPIKRRENQPKKPSTIQPASQSTGSPPPLIPSNGMGCVLIIPNKKTRTLGTLFYGMDCSPLIRSIILATPPGEKPILTMDRWLEGVKDYESFIKKNTQPN